MSEKATLLTSIPPVAKSTPAKKASLLTSVDDSSKTEKSSGLLTATADNKVKPVESKEAAVGAVEVVASEGVAAAESGKTITMFQGAIYASFVLTFCLAGFAAVVLFRKATKLSDTRFVMSTRAMGVATALIALHGFFATYLYTNYLNAGGTIPVFATIALWALVGPAIAVVLNYLLTPGSAPEKGAVIFDACAYFAIFTCASIALVPSIKEDAALIFSLLGGFLFIIPVARSFTAFRKAKARHPELREGSDQVLIYSLLFLPALLPILVFANVCKMGDELTLFLFNFITFDFVLVAGLAMIASADDLTSEEAAESEAAVEPEAQAAAASTVQQPQPEVVEFNAPRQPKKSKSKKLPPRKPAKVASGAVLPPAPRKPGAAPAAAPEAAVEAANAPSRIKAPAKPKKRF